MPILDKDTKPCIYYNRRVITVVSFQNCKFYGTVVSAYSMTLFYVRTSQLWVELHFVLFTTRHSIILFIGVVKETTGLLKSKEWKELKSERMKEYMGEGEWAKAKRREET